MSVALSVFGVYLVVGTIFYDLFFRDCEQPVKTLLPDESQSELKKRVVLHRRALSIPTASVVWLRGAATQPRA